MGLSSAILYYTNGVANTPEILQTGMMMLNLFVASLSAAWPYMIAGCVVGLLLGFFWGSRD